MQKIIAAIIMIVALAVAGTAGAAEWIVGETRPGLGQFGIGDTITDPGAGISLVIPADAQAPCLFLGEPGDVLRNIDPQTASDALSLAYLARARQLWGSYVWRSDLDLPGYRLIYHSYGNEGQWFMARPLQNAGLATYDLDSPATGKVTAVGTINIIANGVKYENVNARGVTAVGVHQSETIDITYDDSTEPPQYLGFAQINMDGYIGYCQAYWVSPTDPTPPADPCAEATTDLERGTCNGRETMTSEARTGIIVGLEVY